MKTGSGARRVLGNVGPLDAARPCVSLDGQAGSFMESGAAVGEGKVGWEELGHCILSGAAASIWSEPNFNAIINGADCFLCLFPFFSCRVCRVR